MDAQGEQNAPRHNPGAGGREDCWSEGATETLIEAWGDRYLKLNRGNLRQKDWKEVSDVVNSRQNGVKPSRTDIQCKNRIDTLKKKYKLEKSKPSPSNWPFYPRLDYLIGPSSSIPSTKRGANPSSSIQMPTTVTLTVKPKPKIDTNSNPKPIPTSNPNSAVVYAGVCSRLKMSGSTESSLGGGNDGRDEDDDVLCGGRARRHSRDYVDFSEASAYKELARAILRFGEIYERIESSKQQQILELEKQRMEFTRELEFERMNMFVETQVKLEKRKRSVAKRTPRAGKKS